MEDQVTTAPVASFAELGLCDEIVEALSAKGITAPFPVQALTIPDALGLGLYFEEGEGPRFRKTIRPS